MQNMLIWLQSCTEGGGNVKLHLVERGTVGFNGLNDMSAKGPRATREPVCTRQLGRYQRIHDQLQGGRRSVHRPATRTHPGLKGQTCLVTLQLPSGR